MDCSNLKVGDKVAVVHLTTFGRSCYIAEVEKVNRATLQVQGDKYYRENGERQESGWHPSWLATVEDGQAIIKEEKRQRLIKKINRAIKEWELKSTPELVNELIGVVTRHKELQSNPPEAEESREVKE